MLETKKFAHPSLSALLKHLVIQHSVFFAQLNTLCWASSILFFFYYANLKEPPVLGNVTVVPYCLHLFHCMSNVSEVFSVPPECHLHLSLHLWHLASRVMYNNALKSLSMDRLTLVHKLRIPTVLG